MPVTHPGERLCALALADISVRAQHEPSAGTAFVSLSNRSFGLSRPGRPWFGPVPRRGTGQ